MVRTCEVALPLPLRTAFTYRIPDALDEPAVTGARVVVPFHNRAMLGVVVGRGDCAEGSALRDLADVLDTAPALSPRLVELGRWISNYYLSPIGETFRAMLPPSADVRFDRQWRMGEAGLARLQELQSRAAPSELESEDLSVLRLLQARGGAVSDGILRKLPKGSATASRLLRIGAVVAEEASRSRSARIQRLFAWKDQVLPAPVRSAEQRVHRVLTESTKPLPLA